MSGLVHAVGEGVRTAFTAEHRVAPFSDYPRSHRLARQPGNTSMSQRRHDMPPGDCVEHLDVRIDRVRRTATIEGRSLALTGTEFRLLEFFLRAPGPTF